MVDSTKLLPEHFASYFEALHGTNPFPWQSRLAAQLAESGSWPSILDLPTGSGKTAALDIAVFHLALQADLPKRAAPLRVVYVVDRRTIVDQAHTRAVKIQKAIEEAKTGILYTVRTRLASYSRDGIPLMTALLRGAVARSDLWARSPDQPLVAVSTVDQVGSRILFRGYGVSDAMKPIHAGLLGTDALYLLDEVHLSEPFRQTLAAISQRYSSWAKAPVGRPIAVVEMSATAGRTSDSIFRLDSEDERHDVLSRRLKTPKPTKLALATERTFETEIVEHLQPLASQPGAVVGVVVNRVATARDLHERLGALLPNTDVRLLTGRMRPFDREQIEHGLFDRIAAGRQRSSEQHPLVVVATQCIEAGADFDFDALVTECASLDALRQRFGRLDRLGALGGRAIGVIVARKETLEDDPVYGAALGATWRWLNDLQSTCEPDGQIDFGVFALAIPPDATDRGLLAPKADAPILLPSHLDAWVQTSPMPEPDPDVALWLHGPDRGIADVQVIWRGDLDERLLEIVRGGAIPQGSAAREIVLGMVESLTPASAEVMSVPFLAVRRWLDGRSEPQVFDVEGARDVTPDNEWKEKRDGTARAAVLWRGDTSDIIEASALRPGDTIVVPASYGGVRNGTWAPHAIDRVVDVAELANLRQRGRAQLRLHPQVLAGFPGASLPPPPPPEPQDSEEIDDQATVVAWLATIDLDQASDAARTLLSFLKDEATKRRLRIERLPLGLDSTEGEYFVVTSRRRVSFDGAEISTEDDRASFTGVAITLADHLTGVGAMAAGSANRLGLPESIAADIALAGRWHDVGKIDPRFQRLLHGGSEFKTLVAKEPLAKSAMSASDRRARLQAQNRAGYPRGARHEVMSVALMATAESDLVALASDWELVQHLVASHHGRCRPLAPWVPDVAPVDMDWTFDGITVSASSAHELARLDSGIGERFWSLVRQYGWWGLAWLEAILRLGDHRRSEEEQFSRDGRRHG